MNILDRAEDAIVVKDGGEAMEAMKRAHPEGYMRRVFPEMSRATDDEIRRAQFVHFAGDLAKDLYRESMEIFEAKLNEWLDEEDPTTGIFRPTGDEVEAILRIADEAMLSAADSSVPEP